MSWYIVIKDNQYVLSLGIWDRDKIVFGPYPYRWQAEEKLRELKNA